jgi:hypothetical protein
MKKRTVEFCAWPAGAGGLSLRSVIRWLLLALARIASVLADHPPGQRAKVRGFSRNPPRPLDDPMARPSG